MAKKADYELYSTAVRRARVLELAKETGCSSWQYIADTIASEFKEEDLPKGWDRRYAHKDFIRELEAVRNFNLANAQEIRALEDARLDDLYMILNTKIKSATDVREISSLAGRILGLMRRRAKMHGLDMPILIRFIDKVDFAKLPDDLLERIAAGESPEVVLSGYLDPGEA